MRSNHCCSSALLGGGRGCCRRAANCHDARQRNIVALDLDVQPKRLGKVVEWHTVTVQAHQIHTSAHVVGVHFRQQLSRRRQIALDAAPSHEVLRQVQHRILVALVSGALEPLDRLAIVSVFAQHFAQPAHGRHMATVGSSAQQSHRFVAIRRDTCLWLAVAQVASQRGHAVEVARCGRSLVPLVRLGDVSSTPRPYSSIQPSSTIACPCPISAAARISTALSFSLNVLSRPR
jgi:hypothetical protein